MAAYHWTVTDLTVGAALHTAQGTADDLKAARAKVREYAMAIRGARGPMGILNDDAVGGEKWPIIDYEAERIGEWSIAAVDQS